MAVTVASGRVYGLLLEKFAAKLARQELSNLGRCARDLKDEWQFWS